MPCADRRVTEKPRANGEGCPSGPGVVLRVVTEVVLGRDRHMKSANAASGITRAVSVGTAIAVAIMVQACTAPVGPGAGPAKPAASTAPDPASLCLTESRGGQDDAAIRDCSEALKRSPDQPLTYDNRARAYFHKGQLDPAVQDLNQAIALKPDLADALTLRGRVALAKQQYDQALADLDQAIKLKPDSAEALAARGLLHAEQRRYDRALPDLEQAVKLAPDDAEALNNLGAVRYHRNQFQAAIPDYDRALALAPGSVQLYASRGWMKLKLNQFDAAAVDFTAALKIDPKHAPSLYGQSLIEKLKGDRVGGKRDIETARALDPEVDDHLVRLGLPGHQQ